MEMTKFAKHVVVLFIFTLFDISKEKSITDVEDWENEIWLSDKENYDVSLDYLGDDTGNEKMTKTEGKCPPVPEILTSSACMAKPCFSDKHCGKAESRCCDNGCVFTCLSYPIGPTYIDWVREPKSKQINGISWLIKGPALAEELEPCSTTPYEDEDPLLCPTGYICHVERPGNAKKDLPNLGHCIPEKDVFVRDKAESNIDAENMCYFENYLLADGAKINLKNKSCFCKQGFLACLERD